MRPKLTRKKNQGGRGQRIPQAAVDDEQQSRFLNTSPIDSTCHHRACQALSTTGRPRVRRPVLTDRRSDWRRARRPRPIPATTSEGGEQTQLMLGLGSIDQRKEPGLPTLDHRKTLGSGEDVPCDVIDICEPSARSRKRVQQRARFAAEHQAVRIQYIGGRAGTKDEVAGNGTAIDFHGGAVPSGSGSYKPEYGLLQSRRHIHNANLEHQRACGINAPVRPDARTMSPLNAKTVHGTGDKASPTIRAAAVAHTFAATRRPASTRQRSTHRMAHRTAPSCRLMPLRPIPAQPPPKR
ncbi:hypothetical protein BLA14095_01577 [Burkholderia lata]|nr:hypothetical protein BLA14095_01577 [Burkholderia lata]